MNRGKSLERVAVHKGVYIIWDERGKWETRTLCHCAPDALCIFESSQMLSSKRLPVTTGPSKVAGIADLHQFSHIARYCGGAGS
jgi:hypothetical protein